MRSQKSELGSQNLIFRVCVIAGSTRNLIIEEMLKQVQHNVYSDF